MLVSRDRIVRVMAVPDWPLVRYLLLEARLGVSVPLSIMLSLFVDIIPRLILRRVHTEINGETAQTGSKPNLVSHTLINESSKIQTIKTLLYYCAQI